MMFFSAVSSHDSDDNYNATVEDFNGLNIGLTFTKYILFTKLYGKLY